MQIKNMQKAFTMIELIFVIVIIGILAAVAIPKLAATRDDAKISAIISNARTAYGDFNTYYTSQGNALWRSETIDKATNVPLEVTACGTPATAATPLSGTTFMLCDGTGQQCLTMTTEAEGNLTVAVGSGIGVLCEAVNADGAIRALIKEHVLGGSTVTR